jgi:hypothetical protein
VPANRTATTPAATPSRPAILIYAESHRVDIVRNGRRNVEPFQSGQGP